MQVDSVTLDILKRSRIEDTLLFLPNEQLAREVYYAVNKVLVAMGGKWQRAKKAHVFEWDVTDQLADILASGEVINWKKTLQFYETPSELAERMVYAAHLLPGKELRILEPSAGRGAIAKVVCERMDPSDHLLTFEKDPKNQEFLLAWMGSRGTSHKDVAFQHWPGGDFLDYEDSEGFDRIIANPPFAKRADVKHVRHMWKLLRMGGTLVSVMSAGAKFREDRLYAEWRTIVAQNGGTFESLPAGAFKASGTEVSTVLCVVTKQFCKPE